jgi:hypothetical protein
MKELRKKETVSMLPTVDSYYLENFLIDLLNTPSPTGYAYRAVDYTEKVLTAIPGVLLSRTRKGALIAKFPGKSSEHPRASDCPRIHWEHGQRDQAERAAKLTASAESVELGRDGSARSFTNQDKPRGSPLAVKASGMCSGSQAIGERSAKSANTEVRLMRALQALN